MKKIVVDFDLLGYSTISAGIEESLGGPKAVMTLNLQIQGFKNEALAEIGVKEEDVTISNTGDGAILAFNDSTLGYNFALALHSAANRWNAEKNEPIAKRYFRIGIAMGPIEVHRVDGKTQFAGMVIARAVRLESRAWPGGILIDEHTHHSLPVEVRRDVSGPVEILGKRDEKFNGYEKICFEADRKTMNFFKPPEAIASMINELRPHLGGKAEARKVRKNILEYLGKLRPHSYSDLVFCLGIPVDRRPPSDITPVKRKEAILEWANEEEDGIEGLLDCLTSILSAQS